MNKKLKIVVFIQVIIVTFLLGILLGMHIQKKRMNDNNNTQKDNIENSNTVNSDSKDTDNSTTESQNTTDNNHSTDAYNLNNGDSSHVVVERDVDYGAMDVPEPTTDDWLFTDGNQIVDADAAACREAVVVQERRFCALLQDIFPHGSVNRFCGYARSYHFPCQSTGCRGNFTGLTHRTKLTFIFNCNH